MLRKETTIACQNVNSLEYVPFLVHELINNNSMRAQEWSVMSLITRIVCQWILLRKERYFGNTPKSSSITKSD